MMKDGRIVQIGVPEEIVANPADAYVADFVQHISTLGIVQARADHATPVEFTRDTGQSARRA